MFNTNIFLSKKAIIIKNICEKFISNYRLALLKRAKLAYTFIRRILMDKIKDYKLILKQADNLLQNEHDLIANMSNISSLLYNSLPDVSYAGFYRFKDKELILGPFQGPIACMHIPIGKGVCGVAAKTQQIQIVPNVHEFSGHIACDAATNSEIVVPLIKNNSLLAVLDLDSNNFNRFDQIDAEYLPKIADLVSK